LPTEDAKYGDIMNNNFTIDKTEFIYKINNSIWDSKARAFLFPKNYGKTFMA
jgi:hypothetical protein